MKTRINIRRLAIMALCAVILVVAASCKTHRDCQGRKKTAKTQMGGWL